MIAGYHWFTDWGRDTMISLEGLTLATGRHAEAGSILRMFAHHVRDGLVPNMFPEGANEGLYHTADATLWFFHAIDRYLAIVATITARSMQLLPTLRSIIDHHLRGTRFGIGVDPADGLLRQGAPGYQLTWMDAKAGDWVVTPRRGKAVEINALWYNALRLMERWLDDAGESDAARRDARGGRARARLVQSPVLEPGDRLPVRRRRRRARRRSGVPPEPAVRDLAAEPGARSDALASRVLGVVERELLTPVGLRSLAPLAPRLQGDLPRRPPRRAMRRTTRAPCGAG